MAKPKPAAEKPTAEPTPPSTTPPSTTPKLIRSDGTDFYDRYMQAGYAASREPDYARALLFFQRALDEKPEDSYATTAITNMEAALAASAEQP